MAKWLKLIAIDDFWRENAAKFNLKTIFVFVLLTKEALLARNVVK